jgi:hypothetical protein
LFDVLLWIIRIALAGTGPDGSGTPQLKLPALPGTKLFHWKVPGPRFDTTISVVEKPPEPVHKTMNSSHWSPEPPTWVLSGLTMIYNTCGGSVHGSTIAGTDPISVPSPLYGLKVPPSPRYHSTELPGGIFWPATERVTDEPSHKVEPLPVIPYDVN